MCIGSSKPVSAPVREDPQIKFVDGNIYDDKKDPFENPAPSDNMAKPTKKKEDNYNQGGVEGSNSGLNIT